MPLVCYEAIFPDEVAAHMAAQSVRPSLMLNVTNDGWFGRTAGPYQHLDQARLRAIEQGAPLARAANTGISALIDPYGRILAQSPLAAEAVIDVRLPKVIDATVFSRWPRLAPLSLWLLALLGAVWRSPPELT